MMNEDQIKALALRVAEGIENSADDADACHIGTSEARTHLGFVSTAEARALAAFLREAVGGRASVAPLEWVRDRKSYDALVARPGFGRAYAVVPLDDGFIIGGRPKTIYPTEVAAQDAAQAIHAAHIRSALLPTPPAAGAPDAE